MAAVAKRGPFATISSRRGQAAAAGERRNKVSPNYLALVFMLVLMFAIMALAMWLASIGGESTQPLDYWMLTP